MEKKLNFIYPILFLIFGLFIFFHPMFFDFSKMAGDLGDARLVSYLLDHGFLYLTGDNFHSSYFNIPFFYPYQNQLFYTDILFGGTILYVPIRLFVKNPFSAVQIWLILVSVLYIDVNIYLRIPIKIAMLPIIVGIGFEFIRYAGKHNNLFVRILSAPGLWIQRLTTKEPDISQIEVAIASLKAALPDIYPVTENVSETEAAENDENVKKDENIHEQE